MNHEGHEVSRSGKHANPNEQGAQRMKKKIVNESLLNVIARQVGRAAGTIARATKLVTLEDNAAVNPKKAAQPRRKSKPNASARASTKKKAAKSPARKSRSKTTSPRKKTS
jgi:hypothetical protein